MVNKSYSFFSFGCHPLDGVTLGGPPPGDATEWYVYNTLWNAACTRHKERQLGLPHVSLNRPIIIFVSEHLNKSAYTVYKNFLWTAVQ